MHPLRFVLKRAQKRLVKAYEAQWKAFVPEYAVPAEPGYFLLTGPTSGRPPGCGASGDQGRGGVGGLDQRKARGGGQLLFGRVLEARWGGVDKTGGKQQRREFGGPLTQLRERRPKPLNVV